MTEIKAAWMEGYEHGYAAAQEEITKLIAERDAAVADLAKYHYCADCKHAEKADFAQPCRSCKQAWRVKELKWQWRGLSLEKQAIRRRWSDEQHCD